QYVSMLGCRYFRAFSLISKLSASAISPIAAMSNTRLLASSAAPVGGSALGVTGVAVGAGAGVAVARPPGGMMANVTSLALLLGLSPGLLVVSVALLRPSGGWARSLTRTRMRMVTSSPACRRPMDMITVRPLLETSPCVVVASITSM